MLVLFQHQTQQYIEISTNLKQKKWIKISIISASYHKSNIVYFKWRFTCVGVFLTTLADYFPLASLILGKQQWEMVPNVVLVNIMFTYRLKGSNDPIIT